jgi:serine/threonine protein phosphatase PrpC
MVHYDPDITVYPIKDTQIVLMACDGIWEAQLQDYGEAVTQRLHAALKHGKPTQCVTQLFNSTIAGTLNPNQ